MFVGGALKCKSKILRRQSPGSAGLGLSSKIFKIPASPSLRNRSYGSSSLSRRIMGGLIRCFLDIFDLSNYTPKKEVNRPMRISLVAGGMLLFTAIVSFRLYKIQDTEHDRWVLLAGKQHNTSVEIQGVRGTLRDTAGRVLGVSVQAVSFGVHPRQIKNPEEAAASLAGILDISKEDIFNILKQDKPFVWLARGLPAGLNDKVESLNLNGVVAVPEFRRYYPHGELAAPLLGRVNRDGVGQSGIESAYDRNLKAETTTMEMRRDAKGRLVAATTDNDMLLGSFRERSLGLFRTEQASLMPAALFANSGNSSMRKEGHDVYLSIDAYIQNIVEEELRRGHEDAKAKHVIGVIMDASTGEILGMGQSPSFNPNQYKDVDPQQLKNFVLQDSFEPGSTFKPLVAAAALDQDLTKVEEQIDCEMGKYQVGKYTIRDAHPSGVLSVRDVLVRSSNVGMAKLGQRMGREKLGAALKEYGLGKATGIKLKGEADGIMRDPKTWANIDVATHSFGQGISVTALQLVQAYSAIANHGLMVKPTVLKRKTGEVETKRVLKAETADKMFEMLTGVTEDDHGTAKGAHIQGVKIAGKTGTAQKSRVGAKGYDPDRVLGSFIGIVDASDIGINRRLIMLVAVDEPGVKPRWGGVVAAPVFRRTMERVLSHLLTTDKNQVQTARSESRDNNM